MRYAYILHQNGVPFYVGKGTSGRCFSHFDRGDFPHQFDIKVFPCQTDNEALEMEASLYQQCLKMGYRLLNRKHLVPTDPTKHIDIDLDDPVPAIGVSRKKEFIYKGNTITFEDLRLACGQFNRRCNGPAVHRPHPLVLVREGEPIMRMLVTAADQHLIFIEGEQHEFTRFVWNFQDACNRADAATYQGKLWGEILDCIGFAHLRHQDPCDEGRWEEWAVNGSLEPTPEQIRLQEIQDRSH